MRQIRRGSSWTSPVFMEGGEGECLQGFDCDALAAIAKYCFVLLVIYLFVRSFIQQTLLSTDYVPANGQRMK